MLQVLPSTQLHKVTSETSDVHKRKARIKIWHLGIKMLQNWVKSSGWVLSNKKNPMELCHYEEVS